MGARLIVGIRADDGQGQAHEALRKRLKERYDVDMFLFGSGGLARRCRTASLARLAGRLDGALRAHPPAPVPAASNPVVAGAPRLTAKALRR